MATNLLGLGVIFWLERMILDLSDEFLHQVTGSYPPSKVRFPVILNVLFNWYVPAAKRICMPGPALATAKAILAGFA